MLASSLGKNFWPTAMYYDERHRAGLEAIHTAFDPWLHDPFSVPKREIVRPRALSLFTGSMISRSTSVTKMVAHASGFLVK